MKRIAFLCLLFVFTISLAMTIQASPAGPGGVETAVNTLPYRESFESFTPGLSFFPQEGTLKFGEDYGWYAALEDTIAQVIASNYTWTSDFPISQAISTHEQVLQLQNGGVSNRFEATAEKSVFVDCMLTAKYGTQEDVISRIDASTQVAIFVNKDGKLVARHGGGVETAWATLEHDPIEQDEWFRLTVPMRYDENGENYFAVRINGGDAISHADGYDEPGGNPDGPWFKAASHDNMFLSAVSLQGDGMLIDDFVVKNTDPYLPEYSTYGFSYDLPEPVMNGVDVAVDVSLDAQNVGEQGYDSVRLQFDVTERPAGSTVSFFAIDSGGTPHEFENSGVWGPPGGFPIAADYSATTEWTLNFSDLGSYTISFELIDLNDENAVIAQGSQAVTVYAAYDVTTGIGYFSLQDAVAAAGENSAILTPEGWHVADGMSIQAAIDAAQSNDTIHVAAGTYAENIVVNTSVVLQGFDKTATILDGGASGGVATISANNVTLQGFMITGSGSTPLEDGGVILQGVTNCVIANNIVQNNAGFGIALQLADKNTIEGNLLENNTIAGIGLMGSSGNTLQNNTVASTAQINGLYGYGVVLDGVDSSGGDHPDVFSAGNLLDNNTLSENLGDGVYLGWNCNENTLTSNTISGNGNDGIYFWKSGSNNVVGNTITENAVEGIQLMGSPGNTITGNIIANSVKGIWVRNGWTQYQPHEAGFELISSGNVIQENSINGNSEYGIVYEDNADYTADDDVLVNASKNWWGDATGPSHAMNLSGTGNAVSDNVTFSPWYEDPDRNDLRYLADNSVETDETIDAGSTVTVPGTYTVGDGSNPTKITVNGGTLNVGTLNLTAGSSIEVINGELVLGTADGGTHTMAGTFTIYNSFDSMYIEADTEFSGSTLALISDIHVTPGVTLTVSGSLTLDGCRVDSTEAGSTFALNVTETGTLKMIRTELTDADITLAGEASELRDNLLTDVEITVTGTDNAIFHNLFLENSVTLTDSGVGTVTSVDGWGNVTAQENTANNLAAQLTTTNLDFDRTLEAGNLYIQPGDTVRINLDVAALLKEIGGVEVMMGFNTDFFTTNAPSALGPVDPWIYEFHNVLDSDGVYGKIDAGVGLSVLEGTASGTTEDGTVAQIDLGSHADAEEGVTRFYFRTWKDGDTVGYGTRLTGYNEVDGDYELTPFTLNSGLITLDETVPAITNFAARQVLEPAVTNDVFGAVYTYQGMVTFTVEARDELAGVASNSVVLMLTNTVAEASLSPVLTGTEEVIDGDVTWTRYTFEVEITASTPNGAYDAEVFAADRSGNYSEVLLGDLEINKNQVEVTVAMQGAYENDFTREVTFVATDVGGNILAAWIRTLDFVDGVGTDTLIDAPDGMDALSAKTGVSLRRKIDVSYDVDGQATGEFTGTGAEGRQLLGGDLNGDNAVNIYDFNRLRYYWYTYNTSADITGSGYSNLDDLNVLKVNFNASGDPE